MRLRGGSWGPLREAVWGSPQNTALLAPGSYQSGRPVVRREGALPSTASAGLKSGGAAPARQGRWWSGGVCALLPERLPSPYQARPARRGPGPARGNSVPALSTARLQLLPSPRLRARQPPRPQGPGRAGAGPHGRAREGGRRLRLRRSNRWDPAAWWRRAREEEEEEEEQWQRELEQEQDEPRELTAAAAARAQARSRSRRPGPLPASHLPWPPAGRPAPSAPPGPELPPSLLHPGRGEEEAEQEASRSRRRQRRRRRRRRPSRTERAAAPRVRPPPVPIKQLRGSHTAGQPGPRRAPARPNPA